MAAEAAAVGRALGAQQAQPTQFRRGREENGGRKEEESGRMMPAMVMPQPGWGEMPACLG